MRWYIFVLGAVLCASLPPPYGPALGFLAFLLAMPLIAWALGTAEEIRAEHALKAAQARARIPQAPQPTPQRHAPKHARRTPQETNPQ